MTIYNTPCRRSWLAQHLTQVEGRAVTDDEVIERAIHLFAERTAGDILGKHFGAAARAFAAPVVALMIPRGNA